MTASRFSLSAVFRNAGVVDGEEQAAFARIEPDAPHLRVVRAGGERGVPQRLPHVLLHAVEIEGRIRFQRPAVERRRAGEGKKQKNERAYNAELNFNGGSPRSDAFHGVLPPYASAGRSILGAA